MTATAGRGIEYTEVSDWYSDVADCLVRNYCELFNLGDDSHRIFNILPEIAGCTPRYNTRGPNNITEVGPWVDYFPRRWNLEIIKRRYGSFTSALPVAKKKNQTWTEDPSVPLERGDTAVTYLLHTVSESCVIIVDKQAC